MLEANLLWVALPIQGLAWVNGANDVAKGVSTLFMPCAGYCSLLSLPAAGLIAALVTALTGRF